MTTVGYGEIVPTSDWSRLFVMFLLFFLIFTIPIKIQKLTELMSYFTLSQVRQQRNGVQQHIAQHRTNARQHDSQHGSAEHSSTMQHSTAAQCTVLRPVTGGWADCSSRNCNASSSALLWYYQVRCYVLLWCCGAMCCCALCYVLLRCAVCRLRCVARNSHKTRELIYQIACELFHADHEMLLSLVRTPYLPKSCSCTRYLYWPHCACPSCV